MKSIHTPEIWNRFVEEAKTSSNIGNLCEQYGISRQSGFYWIRQYRDGPLCILCEQRPFIYLKSRHCERCKVQTKQTDMDKQYASGKLFLDEQMEIEAYEIIPYLKAGLSGMDVAKKFGKNPNWVSSRLKSIGKRVLDYKPRKNYSNHSSLIISCSMMKNIKLMEKEIVKLKNEIRKLKGFKPIWVKEGVKLRPNKPTLKSSQQQLYGGKRNIVPKETWDKKTTRPYKKRISLRERGQLLRKKRLKSFKE